MTNHVSGPRLLAVVGLLLFALLLGLSAGLRWDGRSVLAIIFVVAAVVLTATVPRGTLADDEAETEKRTTHFEPRSPSIYEPGALGDIWFVMDRGGLVVATFRHNGHGWHPVASPRGVR